MVFDRASDGNKVQLMGVGCYTINILLYIHSVRELQSDLLYII